MLPNVSLSSAIVDITNSNFSLVQEGSSSIKTRRFIVHILGITPPPIPTTQSPPTPPPSHTLTATVRSEGTAADIPAYSLDFAALQRLTHELAAPFAVAVDADRATVRRSGGALIKATLDFQGLEGGGGLMISDARFDVKVTRSIFSAYVMPRLLAYVAQVGHGRGWTGRIF
jgi:hypothetical protein